MYFCCIFLLVVKSTRRNGPQLNSCSGQECWCILLRWKHNEWLTVSLCVNPVTGSTESILRHFGPKLKSNRPRYYVRNRPDGKSLRFPDVPVTVKGTFVESVTLRRGERRMAWQTVIQRLPTWFTITETVKGVAILIIKGLDRSDETNL